MVAKIHTHNPLSTNLTSYHHYNASCFQHQKSSNIPLAINNTKGNSEYTTNSHDSRTKQMYDQATWQMYYRIRTVREHRRMTTSEDYHQQLMASQSKYERSRQRAHLESSSIRDDKNEENNLSDEGVFDFDLVI